MDLAVQHGNLLICKRQSWTDIAAVGVLNLQFSICERLGRGLGSIMRRFIDLQEAILVMNLAAVRQVF